MGYLFNTVKVQLEAPIVLLRPQTCTDVRVTYSLEKRANSVNGDCLNTLNNSKHW